MTPPATLWLLEYRDPDEQGARAWEFRSVHRTREGAMAHAAECRKDDDPHGVFVGPIVWTEDEPDRWLGSLGNRAPVSPWNSGRDDIYVISKTEVQP